MPAVGPSTIRRAWRAVWTIGLPLALGACASQPVMCTEIGCTSGVSVTVEGFRARTGDGVDVHACLGTVCRDRAVSDEPAVVFIDADRSAQVSTVVVSVQVSRVGTTVVDVRREVTLHKIAPNGDRCGPVCYVAFVAVSPDGLRQT